MSQLLSQVVKSMLRITFAAGSRLQREQDRPSDLPIHRNGPPGTFVILPDVRISLPTDQITDADERDGHVVVAFGGFRFDGVRDGRLVFSRVRELRPENELSPDRSFTMTLDPAWVESVAYSRAVTDGSVSATEELWRQ